MAKEQGSRGPLVLQRAHPIDLNPVCGDVHGVQLAIHLKELLRQHDEGTHPQGVDILGRRQRTRTFHFAETIDQG